MKQVAKQAQEGLYSVHRSSLKRLPRFSTIVSMIKLPKLPRLPPRRRLIVSGIAVGVALVICIVARATYFVSRNIFDLLRENQKLRSAISNLTHEDTIGYARVMEQTTRDGRLRTRLLFVETDRDDPSKQILRREYEIEGDVVHFDALIVKFGSQLVSDGKERAMYLWRRIYGETMAPEDGYPIEQPGGAPPRYEPVFSKLSLRDRELFWSEIWQLSDDTDRLRSAGIQAVYGSATYKRLRPGFIYVLKISNTGSIFPETVPDIAR